jgi:hypothetical protein
MLAELQRATPQTANPIGVNGKEVTSNDATRPATKSEYAATLEQTGISRQTAHRYQRLAELPESTFEIVQRWDNISHRGVGQHKRLREAAIEKNGQPNSPSERSWRVCAWAWSFDTTAYQQSAYSGF